MTMDRLERADLPEEAMLSVLGAWQAGIWTAIPAIVQAVDLSKATVSAQIAIQARITNPDASQSWETISLLVDCPIVFPAGGGFTLTFPIQVGDEVLMILASRCIDAWWQSGGVQPQAELRMHDLSDGFAIPGPRSVPKVIPSISAGAVQLRSDDGTAFVEIQADKDVRIKTPAKLLAEVAGDLQATVGGNAAVTAAGEINLTAPTIKLVGNVQVSGGTLTHNGVNVGSTHKHSGVSIGSSNTGNPT